MIAGSLQFTLGLQNREFSAAVDAATQKVAALNASSVSNANITRRMGQVSAMTSASMGALRNSMQILGAYVAPQATYAIMAIGQALNALKSAAMATGIGVAAMGPILAAAAAAFVTWAKAIEWVRSELSLVASEASLRDTDQNISDRLRSQIVKAMRGRRISVEEGIGALNMLNNLTGTPEQRAQAQRYAHGVLRPIGQEDVRREADIKLQDILAPVRALGLTGITRAKAQFDLDMTKKLEEALALAAKAGVSERAVLDVFAAANRVGYAELERQFTTAGNARSRPQVSDWERIGFVLSGRFAGATSDPMRGVERNTRDTVRELRRLNIASPSYANV